MIVAMSGSILSACSSSKNSSPASGEGQTNASTGSTTSGGAAADLKGEISIAAWNDAADSLDGEIAGFNKKYPNVKVTVQHVDSSYTKIIPPLTAGMGAPDIIQMQQRDFPNFLLKFPDQFVDLSDKLMAHKDDFAQNAWKTVEQDGKAYAIPWDIGPSAVWYRKDYFEQAGIDPKTLTTWDKFITAGKQLQSKLPKVKMTTEDFTATGDIDVFYQLMNELSGGFYNENGDVDFAKPANIQALEMVKKFKDEGIALNTPSWDERVRAVVNGDVATVIYPVWYAGTISHQAEDQKGKWGVMPLPAFTEGGPNQANSGGSVLAISTQSKNKDAAWAFLEYSLMTNEGQDVQLEHGLFPSWKPYYNTANFKKTDPFFGFPLADFFGTVSTNIPPLDYGAHFLEINTPLQSAIGSVLSGKADIESALKKADADAAKASGLKAAQ